MSALADPGVQAVLHGSLAALFARSAWHKARRLEEFRQALAGYALLPPAFERAAALLFGALETALAATLLWPFAGPAPALAGAALLAVYTGAMVLAWRAGRRDVDCGCGPPGALQPIGPALWVRNALLVAACLAAAPVADARAFGVLDAVQSVLAVAALALLYLAAEQALANARRVLPRVPGPASAGSAS
ncbi:MAG: MauE/DoxX family redox-associated membrane protein [Myxococcota bacterium]